MSNGQPSFIARVGGKSKLAPYIVSIMPEHTTYVEAFVGGGSVLFRKEPSTHEIINDLDKDIYHIFTDVKKLSSNEITKMNLKPNKNLFNHYKETDFKDPFERLQRNMYLTWNSFGSNRRSYAGQSHRNWKSPAFFDRIDAIKDRLKKVKVLNQDFRKVIKKYDSPTTLFYLDPPYEETRDYEHNGIEPEEIYEALKGVQGKFILSYNNSKKMKDLFKGYNIKKKLVHYQRNNYNDNSIKKYELIITNF